MIQKNLGFFHPVLVLTYDITKNISHDQCDAIANNNIVPLSMLDAANANMNPAAASYDHF